MTNPLVSIIVPVYNAQNSVARCLESICSQTYQELEIIVLNDGSTDDSLAICNRFCAKDPRVTVVDKENEGLSITRNVGMRLAQGKYLQFVDSDDHLAPDFTQRMVTAAEQHDATLVISPYWMEIPRDTQKEQLREKAKASKPEDIAKKKLRRKKPEVEYREYGFLPAGVYDQKSYALHLMEKPVTFFYNVVWNKLYRRDVLNAHGLEFTNELIHAEDQQFNVRYLQYAKVIASIDTPGYYYIQNPQGICHTQLTAGTVMQNKLQMLRYYKELFTKLGIYDEAQPRLYKSLVAFSENVSPSSLLQRAIDDAASYWGSLTGLDASSAPVQETDAASRPAKPARASRRKKLDPKPE